MGFGNRMEEFAGSIKGSAHNSSLKLTSILLRLFTGLILGYVLALISQEMVGFGNLVVLFFVIVFTAAFYKISAAWTVFKIIMFDVFCALVLQILKMYILLAP